MPDALKPWQQDFVDKLQSQISTMDNAQLGDAYDKAAKTHVPGLGEPSTDGLMKFAHALADKPGDGTELYYDPQDVALHDQAVWRRDQQKRMLEEEAARRGLVAERSQTTGSWQFVEPPPPPPATNDDGTPIETGHYDDGHSFGWNSGAKASDVDTGHYDDGHAFGWKRPAPAEADPGPTEEELEADLEKSKTIEGDRWVTSLAGLASPPRQPASRARNAAIAIGAAALVVVAAVAFVATRSTTVASDVAQASAAATVAAASTPAASRGTTAAAPDPCTLVTVQEAAAILDGSAITLRPNTPPGPQCTYTPGQKVVFSFQEKSRTAQIRIESVVITTYTGSQATSRFAAKQSPKPTDRDDQAVTGVGDSAVYGGAASDLSVLRGTSYVNVTTTGDRDWGDGNVRYEDVQQKYLSVLIAFAKAALARMP